MRLYLSIIISSPASYRVMGSASNYDLQSLQQNIFSSFCKKQGLLIVVVQFFIIIRGINVNYTFGKKDSGNEIFVLTQNFTGAFVAFKF